MKRLEIAQYIALGATCMTVLGFVINLATQSRWSMTMCGYGVMIGLISYFFGGIKTAVKMAGKIAKWGWIILPFPYDIVTGLVAFFISIFVLWRCQLFRFVRRTRNSRWSKRMPVTGISQDDVWKKMIMRQDL